MKTMGNDCRGNGGNTGGEVIEKISQLSGSCELLNVNLLAADHGGSRGTLAVVGRQAVVEGPPRNLGLADGEASPYGPGGRVEIAVENGRRAARALGLSGARAPLAALLAATLVRRNRFASGKLRLRSIEGVAVRAFTGPVTAHRGRPSI